MNHFSSFPNGSPHNGLFLCRILLLPCMLSGLGLFPSVSFAQSATWNGASAGPGDNLWSTTGNWVGSALPTTGGVLTLGAAVQNNPRQTNTNDLSNLELERIILKDGGWNVSGNKITLTGTTGWLIQQDRIYNASNSTLALDIHFSGTGVRDLRGNATQNTNRILELSGRITGDVGLGFTPGAQDYTLFLSHAGNTFSGDVQFGVSGTSSIAFTTIADKGENSSLGAGNQILYTASQGTGPRTLSFRGTTNASSNRDFVGSAMRSGNDIAFSNDSSNNSSLSLTGNLTQTAISGTLGGDSTIRFRGSAIGVSSFSGAIGNYTNRNDVKIHVVVDTAGTWILSGSNTYTGTTMITAGTLLINGNQSTATGNVTVAAGAVLGGSGTVGGATVINGSLRPGNSIGTLTVANDVTWNASLDNDWVFELGVAGGSLGSPGAGDHLVIDGNFLKGSGGAFVFDFVNTGSVGWYHLVSWTGSGATFDVGDFTAANVAGGLSSTFVMDSNGLYLQVVPEPGSSLLVILAIGAALGLRRSRRSGQVVPS